MTRLLLIELRRVLRSHRLLIVVALSCILAFGHVYVEIIPEINEINEAFSKGWTMYEFPVTVFNRWIGGWPTPFNLLMYLAMPIVVCFVCGDYFRSDFKSGYIQHLAARVGKNRYIVSRLVSLFITGGVAVLIPLVVDFLAVAMFYPMIQPNPQAIGMWPVVESSVMGGLFFENVFAYLGGFAIINFLAGGLIACISVPCYAVFNNKLLSVIGPFLGLTILYRLFYNNGMASFLPLVFMDPAQNITIVPRLAGLFVVLTSITIVIGVVVIRRREWI